MAAPAPVEGDAPVEDIALVITRGPKGKSFIATPRSSRSLTPSDLAGVFVSAGVTDPGLSAKCVIHLLRLFEDVGECEPGALIEVKVIPHDRINCDSCGGSLLRQGCHRAVNDSDGWSEVSRYYCSRHCFEVALRKIRPEPEAHDH